MAEYVVGKNLARTDNQCYAIIRYCAYASGRDAAMCMNGCVINGHIVAVVLYYPTWDGMPSPLRSPTLPLTDVVPTSMSSGT
ncbi:hypothetical protein TcWFU_009526 [Taenia crassiceps]